VGRVSLGIQSFLEPEAAASGRPQSRPEVLQSILNVEGLDANR
jgi:hypothetical protein